MLYKCNNPSYRIRITDFGGYIPFYGIFHLKDIILSLKVSKQLLGNFFKNWHYYVSMPLTLKEFYKKYGLDNFERDVEINKRELFNDLDKLFKSIFNFIDHITPSDTKWAGELLLSAALLESKKKFPPVKNQIAKCMDKKASHLKPTYRHMKENNYINIIKEGNWKRVKLNREDFPEFELITELVDKYWKCRKDREEEFKIWREEK